MLKMIRRTKIVATIGPASKSPEVMSELVSSGMDVARLNFSHGHYEDHAQTIRDLRKISEGLGIPITILQDLQGPKIRVGEMPRGEMELIKGDFVTLVPEGEYHGEVNYIPLDYPQVAEEAQSGMQVLLADGIFELEISSVVENKVVCIVKEGGILKSRKGVNFPEMKLKLPSLTEKDLRDLDFGLSQDVDWISLSFVRSAEDVRILKRIIAEKGFQKPVIAKIEKPQAVEQLEEIIEEANGIMVARGDLGVEMSPEKVPLIQKQIIERCNRKGKTVITATQMLESMIHEPRPTRAEASDVANAIIDGTDAIMLSGETAMGDHPIRSVQMMAKIAVEVESKIKFKIYPHEERNEVLALSQAANGIEDIVDPRAIVVLTTSGRSARYVATERPTTPIYALTTELKVYHGLNLLWGIKPILIENQQSTFEGLIRLAEETMLKRGFAKPGETILVVGGVPAGVPGGTNFVMIHRLGKEM